MGPKTSTREVKNLIIHSTVFEMYYTHPSKHRIEEVLGRIGSFYRFDIIEVTNARLCAKRLFEGDAPAGDVVELFWVCCLISRKYWNDSAEKNAEEIARTGEGMSLQRVNYLEQKILTALEYNIGMTYHEINREIESEINVDKMYRQAVEGCYTLSKVGTVRHKKETIGRQFGHHR
ncbi:hypothetical protein NEDG_01822 [Nematocida displodere]|uniref:Cyclin N-terminal domain-containing protein n=1 Tax=Nematocida displodere TaxID=1805483 RepID=A0A177EH92_9MICR|nr:hypothetical protein NEDG_01822 [Nematocida displodere]